jgi:signal transduction histidine kinase
MAAGATKVVVFDRFDQICNSIAKRAFETVESNGRQLGHESGDWFKAESEPLPPLHAEKAPRDTENQLRTLAESLESEVRLCTQELEARNSEIAQQAEQLRELSNRLQHTQDEERRHIARDLHDSVGQVVTALGIHLARISQIAADPESRKADSIYSSTPRLSW